MAAPIEHVKTNKKLTKTSSVNLPNATDHAETKKLLKCLADVNWSMQEFTLLRLMKQVKTEGKVQFPVALLHSIISGVLFQSSNASKLSQRFTEFFKYDDVRYFAMKYLLILLKTGKKCDAATLSNVYVLLENLDMPTVSDGALQTFLVASPTERETKVSSYQEQKKVFTWLWLEFLKQPLQRSLYKLVLVVLHEKVMPFMTNPLQLSDFLMQSYELGGVISVLALNGLFVLINKFNLNCPNFYEKLYALLVPEIFYVRFRARFLYLLDLFLSSTHISAYLVAAFVKKLSRLGLTAPPDALMSLIPLIYNLLIRHPNCKTLLHSNSVTTLACDPFVESELDLSRCHALDSSLWELKTLREHYHYSIASEARKCEQLLPQNEIDISEKLGMTIDELVVKEKRKKLKNVATTFERPEGLIGQKDAQMNKLWSI